MAFDSSIIQQQLLPGLEPGGSVTTDWMRQLLNKLKANSDNLIEATRQSLTTLEEDYQTADSFLSAGITVELGVLTTAVSAQATRIVTLESQVQTAGTGLLARVTTAEGTIVTTTSAVATLNITVSSHTTSISSLNGSITTIGGQITTLQSTTSTLTGNVSSLTTTVSSHTTSISSINGSITSLTASVSTTAIALTGLDGRVSGYYGIKVISGSIASLELMAAGGGSPSAVVLTSSRFIIDADSINFGSSTVYENTEHTFYTVTSGRRFRWSGPFGTSDEVVLWYGANAVGLGSETRTNGYWSFGTDGKIYYGATELAAVAIAQLFCSSNIYETTVFGVPNRSILREV